MKKRDRKEYLKEYYLKNKEKALAERKKYYQEHKEACVEYAKEYRKKNKEVVNLKRSIYYRKNREECLRSGRLHRSKNKGIYKMYSKNYKVGKINRSPKWLSLNDKKVMECYYNLSIRLTECLGIEFQVDHIIPLQGELVSGLHIPSNLQILTKSANLRKSNTYNIKI